MATIYEELQAAAKTADPNFTDRHSSESENDYMVRLLKTVGTAPTNVWDLIPDDARNWFNHAAQVTNDTHICPPCPGFQTNVTDTTGEPLPEKVEVTTNSSEPATPAGKRGIMLKMRELALLHTDWKPNQIVEALKADGWEKVNEETAWVCHAEVANVLRAAKNIGFQLVPPAVATTEG